MVRRTEEGEKKKVNGEARKKAKKGEGLEGSGLSFLYFVDKKSGCP